MVEVPLLGRIAAGQPLLASENVEETLPLPRSWVRGEEVFLLKVTGESMAPVILPDDLVMVRVQSRVARGEIAVALIDDEATLKRVYEEAGGLAAAGLGRQQGGVGALALVGEILPAGDMQHRLLARGEVPGGQPGDAVRGVDAQLQRV